VEKTWKYKYGNRKMKIKFWILMLNSVFLHSAIALEPVKEVECSKANSICLEGTIDFNSSTGRIIYSGSVKSVDRPGEVKIWLSGTSNINGNRSYIGHSLRFNVTGLATQKLIVESMNKSSIGKTDMAWTLSHISYLDEIVKNTKIEMPFKDAIIKRVHSKYRVN